MRSPSIKKIITGESTTFEINALSPLDVFYSIVINRVDKGKNMFYGGVIGVAPARDDV